MSIQRVWIYWASSSWLSEDQILPHYVTITKFELEHFIRVLCCMSSILFCVFLCFGHVQMVLKGCPFLSQGNFWDCCNASTSVVDALVFSLCIMNADIKVFQFLFSFFLILKFYLHTQDLRLISVLAKYWLMVCLLTLLESDHWKGLP